MKLSNGYWQTYKEVPNDAEIKSHQLMVRAGLIHKNTSGIYTYLPLLLRSIRKLETIIREELDKKNCFELQMSVMTPGELWKESGRWNVYGPEMLRAKDRADRDLCMSPTNEESITDLFRKTVRSYKQLPLTFYQINTKFRDEIRPRYGLLRCREFLMKDAYSFHLDYDCLDNTYNQIFEAYTNIFKRAKLEFIAVQADGGAIASGQSKTHEFQVVADSGEDWVINCPSCSYAANIEKAQSYRTQVERAMATSAKEVATPNVYTIEDVCNLLNLPQHQSLKSLVYSYVCGEKESVVLVLLLGDDSLNELKLKAVLEADHVRPASDELLAKLNLPKGFIGPINLSEEIKVLIDNSVHLDSAYVVGAMKRDYHLTGFVPNQEMRSIITHDLRLARAGDLCPECSQAVELKKGIEVGHIFQLGKKYSEVMQAEVLNSEGKKVSPLMGCYGIGVTRTIQAAIEQNHDENGIIWPKTIAPYQIYFVVISKDPDFIKLAESYYNRLQENGMEVLFDDRPQGPGFKFKDADLLGLPIRITMGERDFKQASEFEIKLRTSDEIHQVHADKLVEFVKDLWEKA